MKSLKIVVRERPCASVADLHQTIVSICQQLNLREFKLCLQLDSNLPKLNSASQQLLNDADITFDGAKTDYCLCLRSGDKISRDYIYRAINYLRLNKYCLATCPEYAITPTFEQNGLLVTHLRDLDLLEVPGALIAEDRRKQKKIFDSLATIENTIVTSKRAQVEVESLKKLIKSTRLRAIRFNLGGKLIPSESNPGDDLGFNPFSKGALAQLSEIDYNLKGYENMQFFNMRTYEAPYFAEMRHWLHGIINKLPEGEYFYVMLLPWIIHGGADLFAVNYLNEIQRQHPDKKILAITCNHYKKNCSAKEMGLDKRVVVLPLQDIVPDSPDYERIASALIYHLINFLDIKYVHNILCIAGYTMLREHIDLLRQEQRQIIHSTYNYLEAENGRYIGATVNEIPELYQKGDIITTDNNRAKQILIEKYGLAAEDIYVHRQLIQTQQNYDQRKGLTHKILWASHIRPEKNPQVLLEIARELAGLNIEIDVYGFYDKGYWHGQDNPIANKEPNLNYKGSYDNKERKFKVEDYDLFLYTSLSDGMPNTILEAAAVGVPIISSAIGGIPDALGNHSTLIQDPRDAKAYCEAVQAFYAAPKQAQKQARELRNEIGQNFSLENFAKQVAEILEKDTNE